MEYPGKTLVHESDHGRLAGVFIRAVLPTEGFELMARQWDKWPLESASTRRGQLMTVNCGSVCAMGT